MATPSDFLTNFNLFLNGIPYAGKVEEITPPNLSLVVESFRGGGMDAPVPLDFGMEALEMSFKLFAHDADALGQFGIGEVGSGVGSLVAGAIGVVSALTGIGYGPGIVLKGALSDQFGGVTPVEITCRGIIKSIESEAWQAGQKAGKTFTIDLHYYRYVQGGMTIHEIDVNNMVRLINGVDYLAAKRLALGM